MDIVRIQDVGLTHASDSDLLEWAAQANRVLLTHDQNTVTKFAYRRMVEGKRMPGVIEVNRSVPMSVAIEDILLLAALSDEGELEGQIIYLPCAKFHYYATFSECDTAISFGLFSNAFL